MKLSLHIALLCSVVNAIAMAEPVSTKYGKVSGVDSRQATVEVFKGIPFASPPVGELRWRPPMPPRSWEGVRICDAFGNKSLQRKDRAAGRQSEDCLYLNVWSQRDRADQKRPVMVWIHGGGFTQGSGHQDGYDGSHLASRGVVLVTINYRLGAAGFMAHPALSAESPHGASGNYAILDQIAALEWVQNNIAEFGGDPDNVTIFGESAGGTSVYLLTATPLSKGLFHRAILQSAWLDPKMFRDLKKETPNGPPAEFDGEEQSQKLFGDDDQDVLRKLRSLPADEMLKKIKQRWPVATDGWVFPKPPREIYAAGEQHDIPVIVGTNRDEGTMFAPRTPFESMDDYRAAMTERYGKDGDRIVEFYSPESKQGFRKVLVQQITDGWFVQPTREFARAMDRNGSPVWMYSFTKPVWGWMGAAHAAEIKFAFGNLENPSPDDKQLSKAFVDYWTQLARGGDPNVEGQPQWPRYNSTSDEHLVMDDKISVATKLRHEACDLLDDILQVKTPKVVAGTE